MRPSVYWPLYLKRGISASSQPVVPSAAMRFSDRTQKIAPTAANAKKSQQFLIGQYLLKNAEFTYIIMKCFPVKAM